MKKYLNRIHYLPTLLRAFFLRVSQYQLKLPVGLQSLIHSSPYARLMRIERPAPLLLLILPILWVLALKAKSIIDFLWFSILFSAGAILMRSAGCIINDIIDRKFDVMVERTSSRPLAAKELKVKNALLLLSVLLLFSLLILYQLPVFAIYIGCFAIIPVTVYPFIKRFTHYAQFFLGFTFNIGVLMAWVTITGQLSIHGMLIYIASAMWTVGYDTIYACQDMKDDIIIGLKSTAIKFQGEIESFIWRIYQLSILSISIVGLASHMNFVFYLAMGVAAYHLYWQTETLDFTNKKSCAAKFNSNVELGFIVLAGIIIGRI